MCNNTCPLLQLRIIDTELARDYTYGGGYTGLDTAEFQMLLRCFDWEMQNNDIDL